MSKEIIEGIVNLNRDKLAEFAEENSVEVRVAVVRACDINNPEQLAILKQLSNDKESEVRAEVARRGVEKEKLSKDTDPLVRKGVVEACNHSNDYDRKILNSLVHDDSEKVRAAIAYKGYKTAHFVNDPYKYVKTAAMWYIENNTKNEKKTIYKDIVFNHNMEEYANSEIPSVRVQVAQHCDSENPEHRRILEKLSNDTEWWVVNEVAKQGVAIEKLILSNLPIVETTAISNADLTNPDHCAALDRLIERVENDKSDNNEYSHKAHILSVIAETGYKLEEMASSEFKVVKIAVVNACDPANPAHKELLDKLAEDANVDVRKAVAEAGYKLNELMNDEDLGVRLAVNGYITNNPYEIKMLLQGGEQDPQFIKYLEYNDRVFNSKMINDAVKAYNERYNGIGEKSADTKISRREYLRKAQEAYDEGRVDAHEYDAMLMNIDAFCLSEEEDRKVFADEYAKMDSAALEKINVNVESLNVEDLKNDITQFELYALTDNEQIGENGIDARLTLLYEKSEEKVVFNVEYTNDNGHYIATSAYSLEEFMKMSQKDFESAIGEVMYYNSIEAENDAQEAPSHFQGEEKLNAEWVTYMKTYRLYYPENPYFVVGYSDNLNEVEKMGYQVSVCDADTMHLENLDAYSEFYKDRLNFAQFAYVCEALSHAQMQDLPEFQQIDTGEVDFDDMKAKIADFQHGNVEEIDFSPAERFTIKQIISAETKVLLNSGLDTFVADNFAKAESLIKDAFSSEQHKKGSPEKPKETIDRN